MATTETYTLPLHDALRGGERQDRLRIGIIPERGRKRSVDAGAGEIDRHVEAIAGAADAETAVPAADEFDQSFAHRHHAGPLLAHGSLSEDVIETRAIVARMKRARNPAMRRSAHTAPRAGRASMLHCNMCAAIDLRERSCPRTFLIRTTTIIPGKAIRRPRSRRRSCACRCRSGSPSRPR